MCADTIEIVEYRPEFKSKYLDLNYEWLTKYFEVEPYDEEMLSNPEREILEKSGYIFFALLNCEVIGTCTLIKINDLEYELTKMCVTEKAQGKGIGKKLLDTAIGKVHKLGANKIYVSTGKILSVALHLYHKKGFREIDSQSSPTIRYNRTEISMMLDISSKNESH